MAAERVLKLRTRGRGVPEIKREVSCRALGVAIDGLRSRGIALEDWLGNVPVTLEQLEDEDQWLSWDLFTRLLERLELVAGGPDLLHEMGHDHFRTSSFAFMRRVASFLVRPRDLYWMGTRWFGPTLFTVLEDEFEDLGDGWLRETLRIPPEYRDCPQLFHVMHGALRAAPGLLGRPDSIVKLDLAPRVATYHIKPPPRASLRRRLAARVYSAFRAGGLIEELTLQQSRLKESHDRLRRANLEIARQADQLRSINRMGRELARHIELDALTDTLIVLLENLLPESGIAIWLQSRTDSSVRLLGRSGDTDGPPARTMSMTAGARSVGHLQFWHAPLGAADENAQLVEELVPWISMALDNARSHEALRAYSTALELRVKERTSERDEATGHLESERVEREFVVEALRRAEEQLRLVEALASLSNLGTGVARQLIEPIDFIHSAAQRALARWGEPGRTAETERILEQIEDRALRSRAIVRGLAHFQHEEPVVKTSTEINRVVELAASIVRPYAADRGARIDVRLADPPCLAYANAVQIELVLVSLLRNAVEAASAGVQVTVTTEKLDDRVRITVADDGPGIPAEDIDRIFEFFYSTRRREGASGVGLSAARSIVSGYGGTLRAESDGVRGATFTFELPAGASAAPSPAR